MDNLDYAHSKPRELNFTLELTKGIFILKTQNIH